MPTIYCYEVELRLTNPNTKAVRSVTRTEYAYSVIDAVMQANLAVAADAGSSKIDFVRVGPPADDIARAATPLTDAVDAFVAGLARSIAPKDKRQV